MGSEMCIRDRSRDIIPARRKTFTFLYDKFTQDNMYQILLQSDNFIGCISKNILVFFRFTVYMRLFCVDSCAGKMTRLTCQRGKTLRVVGLSALGPHNRRPPPQVARCPYLSALRRQIAATCNGRRRCYVSSRDLRLTRRQCPGVVAVFIYVACTLRGSTWRSV